MTKHAPGSWKNGCGSENMNIGDETGRIKIDFDSIPDHVRESLAAATLESVKEFLRKPGGREFLDENKAQRKQRHKG